VVVHPSLSVRTVKQPKELARAARVIKESGARFD